MNEFDQPAHRPPSRTLRRSGPGWLTVAAAWAIVFLAVWSLVRSGRTEPLLDPNATPLNVTPRGDLLPDEQATIRVFKEAAPSVVYITNIEYRRRPFSLNVMAIPQGTGSGFVWDRKGHIVTNFHVLLNANKIEVTLSDRSEWPARLVGVEEEKDLAVLKIEAPAELLTPLPIGTSSELAVGQKVFAIGNPFGFDHTLTTGVISALGREITSPSEIARPIRDVIQTDAAINPGSSGGPLLDSAGRLIGVNTQIASPSGASAGIGFAIPVDTVNHVVPQIIRFGEVRRPSLGIYAASDSVTRDWDIRGVLILEAYEGGAARRAGLRGTMSRRDGRVAQLGDIIIAINNHRVRTFYDLLDALENHQAGDAVKVTIIREGHEQQVDVELQSAR